jgi:hypothetical protein
MWYAAVRLLARKKQKGGLFSGVFCDVVSKKLTDVSELRNISINRM